MSPRNRGRPPSRGQRHPQAPRSAGRISPRQVTYPGWNEPVLGPGDTTEYWFDALSPLLFDLSSFSD
jgi:hypothetical protein